MWNGQRNPVAYGSLTDLGIDPNELHFELMPEAPPATAPSPLAAPAPLTIAQAKEALAATYGVQPQSVEITIRG